MKTKLFITVLVLIFGYHVKSQETSEKNYIFSFAGKEKNHTIGMYGGLSYNYSPLNNKSAYWLGAEAGIVFDKRWTIGYAGYVLNYDKELSELVSDGTYRMEGYYSGMFIEHIVPLKDWWKLSFSWLSGMGTVNFRYDKNYAENREWFEEIIDTEDFASNELGLKMQFRTFGNWWVGANASYRLTSPIELKGEEEFFLRNYSMGISIKYGIF